MKKNGKKSERKFIIELNEHQLNTLQYATEALSRIICGQLSNSFQDICEQAWERDHKTPEHPHGICAEGWSEMRVELEQHLNEIRKLCWNQGRGTYYGIHYNDNADELWDMYQVIRKFKFDHIYTDEEREKMRWTVMGDAPLHTSDQPLITIKE